MTLVILYRSLEKSGSSGGGYCGAEPDWIVTYRLHFDISPAFHAVKRT